MVISAHSELSSSTRRISVEFEHIFVKMAFKFYFSVLAVLTVAVFIQCNGKHLRRLAAPRLGNGTFVGGGSGTGDGMASGTVSGNATAGSNHPSTANLTLGSVGYGSGGSTDSQIVDSDGNVNISQSGFGVSYGTGTGSGGATGDIVSAIVGTGGNGTSNGSFQSSSTLLIPVPPIPGVPPPPPPPAVTTTTTTTTTTTMPTTTTTTTTTTTPPPSG